MQKDEFNDILKQHASGFEMKPASVSFDSVMQKRALEAGIAARKRKRLILYGAAASVSIIALAGLLWFSSSRANKQIIAQAAKAEQAPLLQSDITSPDNSSNTPAAATVTSRPKPSVKESNIFNSNFSEATPSSEALKTASVSASVRHSKRVVAKVQESSVVSQTDKPSPATIPVSLIAASPQFPVTAADPISGGSAASTPVASSTGIPQPAAISSANIPVSSPSEPAQSVIPGGVAGNGTPSSQEPLPATENNPSNTLEHPVVAAVNPAVNNEKAVSILASPDSAIAAADRPAGQVNKGPVWSISALFTPQLFNSVYNANSSANLSWMKQYLENRQQNDRALYSYNTGLKLERKLSDHFSISAGVLYSTVKFEEIRKVSTVIVKPNERVGMAASGDDTSVEVTRNSFDISFHSMEAPVQVYYTIRSRNIYYQATVGASYSYLFKTRSLIFDETDSLNVQETNDSKNSRLQQHSLLLLGGIHIGVQLSKHLSLYAGPVFRYSVNSLYSKDYIIRQQPYFVGAETGIKYSF